MLLSNIISDIDTSKEVGEVDNFFMSTLKPKKFSGKDNVEIAFDKQFEEMCLVINQQLSKSTQGVTVLQFYTAIEHLKKQNKKQNGR